MTISEAVVLKRCHKISCSSVREARSAGKPHVRGISIACCPCSEHQAEDLCDD